MKKQLLSLGIVAILAGFSTNVLAQDYVEKKITDNNGNVSLVVFKSNSSFTSSPASNIFKDVLHLSSNDEMKLVKSETDFTGKFVDEKYQLFHKNIKVEGGVYQLHYKDGKLSSMNGEVFLNDDTNSKPSISAASAFDIAVKNVGAQKYMWEDAEYIAHNDYKKPTGELLYIPVVQTNGKYVLALAYKFDIYAAEPISRDNIYVDAVSGKVVYSDAIMKHADKNRFSENISFGAQNSSSAILFPTLVPGNADTKYSGTRSIETTLSSGKYILNDTTRGGGVHTYNLETRTSYGTAVEFQDNDNNWTSAEFDNANFDNAALDAHWGVEKTYDYFKNTFNRDSYNGNGGILKSYVHYGVNYANASWTGSEMRYGDGNSQLKPLTAFDITAHELGHGVCQTTAGLQYQRESGALNEAMSDIWAASVEYTYAPEKQTWLIGEDIMPNSQYLRSMSDPKSGSPKQPDTYHGTHWYPATIEEGCISPNTNTNDNCGVHYNSGVINHWFYILSVGKTGTNDLGKSYSVTGISIEKAAKIAYRMETVYLTPYSNFMAARNFGIQAAIDLYGENSPEAIATQDAFYAVGLGPKWLQVPDTTPPTVPLNLVAKNTSGTATQLFWDPSTDDNDMDKYIIYKNGTQIGTVSSSVTSYAVTGLTPNTTYSFYVKAQDAYENISSESNTAQVTTMNIPAYCSTTGVNTSRERIKRVVFADIDNASTGISGYEDFSYISTDVEKGKDYSIRITPEWIGARRAEGYAVYIDWNNDGDFDDEGETAFSQAPVTSSIVLGNISIPQIAGENSVKMRVIMAYNEVRPPCFTYTYGQVEEYTLHLKNSLAVDDINSSKTILYPNPVKDIINIQSKIAGEFMYKIFNSAGQLVAKGTSANKEINAQKLPAGNYIIEITDKTATVSTMKFIKK